MKRIFSIFFCLFVVVCIVTSCSKDFNSNAPYKDVTILYGIFNADEQDHYVKIYKGFLTDGDAYDAAQIYDSLYYGDELSVVVQEYVDGKLKATIDLEPVTSIPRELEGDFAAPEQLVYKFTRTLNPDAQYKIVATNLNTGRVITAETNVVGSFFMKSPSNNTSAIGIHSNVQTSIEFSAPDNATNYDIYQTFYYIERDKVTGTEVQKSIRRKINPSILTTTSYQYVPSVLLTVIASELEPDETVDRYITVDSCLKFEVWAVNETLGKYVSSNTVSGSVVLDKLTYTNVECEDGRVAGVLGSRRYVAGWHGITSASQEELVNGDVTGNLGFHYAWEYTALHNQ